jgi:hypothetical protein
VLPGTAETKAQRPAEVHKQIEHCLSDAAFFRRCKLMGKMVGKDVPLKPGDSAADGYDWRIGVGRADSYAARWLGERDMEKRDME